MGNPFSGEHIITYPKSTAEGQASLWASLWLSESSHCVRCSQAPQRGSSVQVPGNWEAVNDGSSARVPAVHVRDSDGISDSWIQFSPDLVAAILGSESTDSLLSLSLSFSIYLYLSQSLSKKSKGVNIDPGNTLKNFPQSCLSAGQLPPHLCHNCDKGDISCPQTKGRGSGT